MQLGHDDVGHTDMKEPLHRVRFPTRLILREEIDAIRIILVASIARS